MASQTAADRVFAELVYKTLKKNLALLVVEVRDSKPSHVDYEIKIPPKGNVGFRAVVTTVVTHHTDYDPDPRSFGDPSDVVARALQHWTPGQTSSWTETRRTFVLMAWNLPDPEMSTYDAAFEYDVATVNSTSCYAPLENILSLIQEKIAAQARERRKADEDLIADQVKAAFKDL